MKRPVLLLLTVGLAAAASAETINCTAITTLPYVIADQGVYCFTGDLSTAIASGVAIRIDTNNVVLDLNGHKLGGLSAGLGTLAIGIYANQRQNITIQNGTVRGFFEGIWLDDASPYTASQGHVVRDIRADQNTFAGIITYGRGCLVQGNQVVSTGGSTILAPNADAYGIWVGGSAHRVIDNDVINSNKQGTGSSYGVFISLQGDNVAVENRVTHADFGIDFASAGSGKYQDNLTSSVTFPYSGGTDAGNNN